MGSEAICELNDLPILNDSSSSHYNSRKYFTLYMCRTAAWLNSGQKIFPQTAIPSIWTRLENP
jgi:hypothetical protein